MSTLQFVDIEVNLNTTWVEIKWSVFTGYKCLCKAVVEGDVCVCVCGPSQSYKCLCTLVVEGVVCVCRTKVTNVYVSRVLEVVVASPSLITSGCV